MRGFLLTELEPYGPGERSSVTRERLAGLMFDMAPNASLSPPQMECLDLLLRQYVGNFLERDAPAADVPFYYDQARPQPPQRWLPGLPPRPTMRFFGPGGAAAKITALAEEAARSDKLPPWAAASGCDPDAYGTMLGMLAKHWSDKPPQRRDRRTSASANVLIVNGLEDTRRAVAASEEALKLQREGGADLKGEPMRDDKYFDRIRFGSVNPDKTSTGKLLRKQLIMPKDVLEKRERGEGRPAPEPSAVSDTSETGIGIALPGRAPWAKVGVLVGYREPDSLQWQVAIVRRLVRGARLSIGLERLRGDAASARVVAVADTKMETLTAAAQSKLGMREAILMGEPSNVLIGEPAALAMGQTYAVFLGESVFSCTLRKIREQGGEFVVAEFDKTSA